MNAARRTPIVLAVLALVALFAAGCGVKAADGDGGGSGGGTETTAPASTTTEPSDSTTETTEDAPDTTEDTPDTTAPDFGDFGKDQLIKLYTDMGLSEEQATCLVNAIFDSTTSGSFDPNDQSAIFDYLATCEIDITDFGGTGGN
ncbi:MAG: hypothetical protein R2746_08695 [Acidimicrobiales bacterium]